MLYTEDTRVKLGGITLPGLIKKLEITGEALIEEVEVEGSKIKPKQAVGYEDCKINVELIIDDTPDEKAIRKIERIKSIFKKVGQQPQPVTIVSPETTAAGISQVLVKSLTYTLTNKSDQYAVALALWEYVPMTIAATTSTSSASAAVPIDPGYQNYLDEMRGIAPQLLGKTTQSPAIDIAAPNTKGWKGEGMFGPLLP